MLSSKKFSRFVVILTAAAVCLCLAAAMLNSPAKGEAGLTMEYETALFDPSGIITVNIMMDENEWQDLLNTAIEESYHRCDVEVNGTVFHNVAIRPAGNSSLSFIYRDITSDRYSFKLEFDRYVEGQTCFGLDKLILHNNYCDPTNMKEPFVFNMYRFIGADASLCNYAQISVNGAYWGVYTALEAPEDSFLTRTGLNAGALYKPDNMDLREMRNNLLDLDFSKLNFESLDLSKFGLDSADVQELDMREIDWAAIRERFADADAGGFSLEGLDFKAFGDMVGAMMGSSGADLTYVDDKLSSYPAIWRGAVTRSGRTEHQRVVNALKGISEGNLEACMDIDNVLKYMAVHTFSANTDSLSGPWAHNYYLYERDGKLNIIPWDYNLCLGGGTTGNDAQSVVNSPIDDSFHATTFFDGLFDNPEYLERYHNYLRILCEEYVQGGLFDAFYTRTRSQIDSLAETDPTAFYSGDAYRLGADSFYELVMLRSQSVLGQAEGRIPSTEEGQSKNPSALIDASGIDMASLGSSMAAGFDFNRWAPGALLSGEGGFSFSKLMNMNADQTSFIGGLVHMVKNALACILCLIVMMIALPLTARYRRKPL